MALNKPTFKVNISANKKATERKSAFLDIAPDSSVRLRVLPPVRDDGMIFTKVTNHFRLKNEENFGMALGCLHEHGNGETGEDCYLCAMVQKLRNGDKAERKVANELKASPRWYLQAFVYDKDTDSYVGPKLVGLSKTTAEAVNGILVAQDESGDDYFCDPDTGQDLIITRTGAGLNTKYSVMPNGKKAKLDDIVPGWEDRIMTDIMAVIDQKLEDPDGQKRAAVRTWPDLDWETLQDQIG
jgi:hypothetical protein